MIEIIIWVSGLIISILMILLAIIGYFLKGIHGDFKDMKESFVELTHQVIRNEEKGRSGYRELDQRLTRVEEDVERLEDRFTT